MGDLDAHLHRRLVGDRVEDLRDGRDRRLVPCDDVRGGVAIDGVATARTRDRSRPTRLG